MNPNFAALSVGALTLYRITEANTDHYRSILRTQPDIDEVLAEFEACYLPKYDEEGRQVRYGLFAMLEGQPAGLSMLVVESWEHGRGYTGADAIPHMRGKGVTPASKAHLFYLGFELLGLNRIYTGCVASNRSSRRSLEKTPGLRLEGILREESRKEDGTFEDEYRYAILKRDWLEHYDSAEVEVLV